MTEKDEQYQSIAALLSAHSTMALATTDESGEPCVAPLFYIPDQELNLYWLSSAKSQHSRNLRLNPEASATVYRQTEKWQEICGLQMRGGVEIVTEREQRNVLVKSYCQRFSLGSVLRLAIRHSTLYVFRPRWFRYIDNTRRFGYRFELTR
jgi:uncharacterized protein YhbP (UPF0306 family)